MWDKNGWGYVKRSNSEELISKYEEMAAMLRDYCAAHGTTLVFSTHLPRQAFIVADKIVLLDGGTLAETGTPEQMRRPESNFGKLFFSQWNV